MENTLNEAEKTQVKEPKKGKKQIQALALAVLTVLWAEQATSPKIAYAGLAHAQQQTAQETQRVNANHILITRQGEIIKTVNNIYRALMSLNPQSAKAKSLFTQMYQLQTEYIAVCAWLQSDDKSDKEFIAGIDETFANAWFKPDTTWKKVYVCDAKWCKI